jgi:hypothetical protein
MNCKRTYLGAIGLLGAVILFVGAASPSAHDVKPVQKALPLWAIPRGASHYSVDDLADAIEHLGTVDYKTGDNSITVYTVAAPPSALIQGIKSLDTLGSKLTYLNVPNSFSELAVATKTMDERDIALYNQDGIDTTSFGPDIQAGVVRVNLAAPTQAELKTFSQISHARSLSSDTYINAVSSYLKRAISSTIVVAGHYGTNSLSGRLNDSSPFLGGDYLVRVSYNNTCSSGFGVTGANSGNQEILTAGHCGTGEFKVDPSAPGNEIGSTTPNGNYLNRAPYSIDAQTLGGSTYLGGVWGGPAVGATTVESVTDHFAATQPAPGTVLTLDGGKTGEVPNDEVGSTGQTFSVPSEGIDDENCIALNLSSQSGVFPTEQQGDSGGPAYEALSNGNVKAAGLIEGSTTYGDPLQDIAWVTEIHYVLLETITTIDE